MATKSICKTVHIRDRRLAAQLMNALESAKGKHFNNVIMTKKVRNPKGDQLKELFGIK